MSETAHSGLSDNTVGALCYITFAPAVVFLMLPPYNANPSVRFHAWQSIFLNLLAILVWLAAFLFTVATLSFGAPTSIVFRLIGLCWVLTWIFCVVNAVNGKCFKLPVLGNLAAKQAGF